MLKITYRNNECEEIDTRKYEPSVKDFCLYIEPIGKRGSYRCIPMDLIKELNEEM